MARAHGTYGKWKEEKCRCEACRMAHSRAKNRKVKVTRPSAGHGSIVKYQNGCRCVDCAAAYSNWVRRETESATRKWH